MHSITCIIQAFDAADDTCSVELQGIGIIDAWLDGVAIAPTVDRSFIVGGMPGVVTMPDINRPCDASLIQVTPPGSPVAYDPDQIITYTGSIEIPTDLAGAGCADIVFPLPYDVVPTVSAAAAHPAAVTISNLTESGFTACVTGGRVSAHHSVSYSSRSSRSGSGTPTASKNKALTVDHNLTEVGTHYILDFEDGDVVFTVESHDSPARNQVSATLSDAFKATLGGGGAPTGPGAAAYNISADLPTGRGTQYYLPWDTLIRGDNAYLDVANPDGLTIPAGGAGDYQIDTSLWFNSGGPPGDFWSIEYYLSVELWRAGSSLLYLVKQDLYQQAADDQYWSESPLATSLTVPACLPGDVIKVGWFYQTSSTGVFGWQGIDHAPANTWVSIAPAGRGSAASKTHRWDATDGDGVVSWTHPIGSGVQLWIPFNPAQDQAGFAVAATDPAFGGIPALQVQPGTYTVAAYLNASSITLPAQLSFGLYLHNDTEGFYQPSRTTYLPYDSANATNGQLLDATAFTVSFTAPFYLAANMLGTYFPTTGPHGGTTFDFEWGGLTLTLTKLT